MLNTSLELSRCPHCNVDSPNLAFQYQITTKDYHQRNRYWRTYACARCGGLITASALSWDQEVRAIYPSPREVDSEIPGRAREYLEQAISSLSAPAGAVMLAASSVDAMLKEKGLTDGSLYTRIDKAAAQHLITKEMATWAHEVRLDANDQRHADTDVELPTTQQAEKCIDFAAALGQFLFALPARVQRGIASAKTEAGA